jgi:uncharacterized protein YbjT (DUF2867 family)
MGGKTRFQPVYVGDIAQAVLKLVTCDEREKHAGKTYELAGPQVMTFRALLETMLAVTGYRRCFISLPAPLARIAGVLGGLCPTPPLTLDQVRSLATDNIASNALPGLTTLGITPTAMGGILPLYLDQYRKTA